MCLGGDGECHLPFLWNSHHHFVQVPRTQRKETWSRSQETWVVVPPLPVMSQRTISLCLHPFPKRKSEEPAIYPGSLTGLWTLSHKSLEFHLPPCFEGIGWRSDKSPPLTPLQIETCRSGTPVLLNFLRLSHVCFPHSGSTYRSLTCPSSPTPSHHLTTQAWRAPKNLWPPSHSCDTFVQRLMH